MSGVERFTLKSAVETAGRVSTHNSKMPGSSFALTTSACQAGAKLAEIEGSVCHKCYAIRLEAYRDNCRTGWTANYLRATTMIEQAPERWARAMSWQINRAAADTGEDYHRWFDAGDLQSVAMLRAIVLTCELTPTVKHWLPTREAQYVKEYLAQYGAFPENLIVRVSSTMVNDAPRPQYSHTSTVHNKAGVPQGHVCPARHQGNKCGDCRACWSLDVVNVSYPLH